MIETTGIVLPNGYSAIAPGHVVSVVTAMEMRERPAVHSCPRFPLDVELMRLNAPGVDTYRALFRTVGEDWLWYSRLVMADEELSAIIENPLVEIFALRQDGRDIGILELDFRDQGTCELAFFGLTKDAIGTGLGRTLMAEAIERAWAKPIECFWVHTCTLDSPRALDFYRRAGFSPHSLYVEVQPDPRLSGAMPPNCAPHVPSIG